MVNARIPEIGEEVTFDEYAQALPGNIPLAGMKGTVHEIEPHTTASDGFAYVDVWVSLEWTEDDNVRQMLVACSPLELVGMRLDD